MHLLEALNTVLPVHLTGISVLLTPHSLGAHFSLSSLTVRLFMLVIGWVQILQQMFPAFSFSLIFVSFLFLNWISQSSESRRALGLSASLLASSLLICYLLTLPTMPWEFKAVVNMFISNYC